MHPDREPTAPITRLRAQARAPRGLWIALLVGLLSLATSATTAVVHAEEAETDVAAIDVVFVLDNSGSMRANDPDFLTRRVVADFTDTLAADGAVDGRVAIVLFDDDTRLVQRLTPASDLASTRRLTSALERLDFRGQRTNSASAIERALYELQDKGRAEARRAIVFLSDGVIDTGDAGRDVDAAGWLRDDLATASADAGIRIFGIAFTEEADYQLMQALARRTEARYYRAFAATELPGVVDDVLTRLSAPDQYDLASLDPAPGPPPVAAAPLPDAESSDGPGLLAWLPILLLLAGGGLALRAAGVFGGNGLRVGANAAPPPAQLLDVGGQAGDAGRAFPLAADRSTIGRDPHNDVVLEDDTISSEHALIEYHDGRYWLHDLRSTNGTRLADKKLAPDERVPLKGGDHVRFADVDLMFVMKGYVPGGATVYMSSSTIPPVEWSALSGSTDAPITSDPVDVDTPSPVVESAPPETRFDPIDAPSGEVVFAEQRERLDPASVLDLDEDLGVASPEADASAGTPAGPTVDPEDVIAEDTFAREAIERAEAVLADLDAQADEPADADTETETEDTDTADMAEAEPIDLDATTKLPLASVAREGGADAQADTPAPDTTPELALEEEATVPPEEIDPLEEPTLPPEDLVVASASGPDEEPTLPPGAEAAAAHATESGLRRGLDYHLARVAELSPPFAAFVDDAFTGELREALPVAAADLIARAGESEGPRVEQRTYTQGHVRFLICGVQGSMDDARDAFVTCHGGFTRLLTEQLESASFRAERCRILALLTFGCARDDGAEPWVTLSIVPDEGEDPRIDLLSYEFLTAEERQEIEPTLDPEISQSGLA